MSIVQGRLPRTVKLLCTSIAAILTIACSTETTWKEEVLLHDGSKIVVERSVDRGGRHEIGQQPPIREQSLTFTVPGTDKQVVWRSAFSEDIGLADFQPLLLDTSAGETYVVATLVGCLSYNKWGRPNPPYAVFKYQGPNWIRIPLEELPVELKTPNLIFSSPDNEVEKLGKRYVTAAMVRQVNSELEQSEYREILRMDTLNSMGCSELVGDGKGRWLGLDWFKKKSSLEACENYCKQEGFSEQHCPCEALFEGAK